MGPLVRSFHKRPVHFTDLMRCFPVFSVPLFAVLPLVPACQPSDPPQTASDQQATSTGRSVTEGGNLVKNSTFDTKGTLPWTRLFLEPAQGDFQVVDGAGCVTIEAGGTNNWDVQVRHREMVVQKGHHYSVSFKIWSDKPTLVRAKVGMSGPPYAEYYSRNVRVTPQAEVVSGQFTMQHPDDPTAEFAFHLGGGLLRDTATPVTVCLDDIQLLDPDFSPEPSQEGTARLPAVRVNQVGYFPGGKKLASVVNNKTGPLKWELSRQDRVVAKGTTTVFGKDRDSGDFVHLVDFSEVNEPGQGYILSAGGEQSGPFSISEALYSELKYDALRYFYHNRSGIEIAMPYATHERWTRPAGHATSDKAVGCAPDAKCDYTLDVRKGWYDAGDHGKYVVNGGISVWTMMNQYERFSVLGSVAPFGDGKLNIPESGNGVPDILDEARWELEFLLGMQVPEGKPHAGMAHHKMHDTVWTGLGLAPHEAERATVRKLRPVSTAATLNLAAAAAQAARLYAKFDAAFAKRCQEAAERAWVAAKKEPTIYADPADGQSGGGPYDDAYVADEFYWAAVELYLTTKKPVYRQELLSSQFQKELKPWGDGVPTTMTWADTSALGTISLSLVPGAASAAQQKQARKLLIEQADKYLRVQQGQGYRPPFSADKEGQYPWGSNSFVINNMIILAYAYDFTNKAKYLEGVVLGMDYLLGRNAMGQSYVTGYGNNPLRHPHHRFWAQQHDPDYPPPPPGAVSGGPNSGLQDGYVRSAGLEGCAPQKCFVDHIDAWSANEITINWNAPFAWVAAFLDENPPKASSGAGKATN